MKNEPYLISKFELRPSKIIPGEVGLFSLREFTEGDIIVENSNWDESRLITWDEFEKIDDSTKRQLIYFCYKDGIRKFGDRQRVLHQRPGESDAACSDNGDFNRHNILPDLLPSTVSRHGADHKHP